MHLTEAELSDLSWRKAWRSAYEGSCVEIACTHRMIAVRDSKSPNGFMLLIVPAKWRIFLSETANGKYDIPTIRSPWHLKRVKGAYSPVS